MNTKIKRDDLIKIVRQNRDVHIAEVLKLREQWRKKMLVMAAKIVEVGPKLRKFPQALQALRNEPVSHTRDFDDAIRMLELTTEDIIDLTPPNFQCLVLNRWNWTDNHVYMNHTYGANNSTGLMGETGEEFEEIPAEINTDFVDGEIVE